MWCSKRRLLPLAALLLLSSTCRAAVTLVQHKVNQSTANAVTVAVTVSSTGSGNLIVVSTANAGTRTVSSISGGCSGSYVQFPGGAAHAVSGTNETDVWYCANSSSGATTVTVTFSGSNGTFNKEAWVHEVSGFTTVGTDVAGVVNSGTCVSNVCSGASITTTSTTGFAVGVIFNSNTIDQNPNSGNEFTSGGDVSATHDAACSLISSTAASHQPVWHDNTASATFTASTAAFKETATSCAPALSLLGVGRCG